MQHGGKTADQKNQSQSQFQNQNLINQSNNGFVGELDMIQDHPEYFVDFNVPWTMNIYYNLNYSKPIKEKILTQTMNFSGDVKITDKWKIGFSSGYDFVNNDFTYTKINFYRDLHCWEMRFNWIPFGSLQSYSLNINVKSSVLQDLKLTRRRDWFDPN